MYTRKYLLGLIVLLILIAGCSTEEGANYEIDGNSVLVNDSNVYIKATPHTIAYSDWVEVEFESKLFSGDIDVAFGFNTDSVQPKSVQRYNPHEETIEYTCEDEFIYTTNPNYFICYETVEIEGEFYNVTKWEHDFLGGNLQEKTAWWNETVNWTDFSGAFESTNYDFDGKNKWYYIQGQSINAGQTYKIRYFLDVKSNTDTKYDIALKPSSETISEAIANEHLYFLDPWVDSNLNDGLLTYLTFDNVDIVDTHNVTDVHEGLRNATNYGATTGEIGILKECFNYTPAESTPQVNITSFDTELRLVDGGTINMWVKWDNIKSGSRLFSRDDANAAPIGNNGYELYYDGGTDNLLLYIDGASRAETITNINGSDDWVMVTALLVEAPGISSIFINGTNVTNTGTIVTMANADLPLVIGNRIGRDRSFGNQIDEFAVWNRTLTETEITNLYNNGLGLAYGSVYELEIENHEINPNIVFADSTLRCNATIISNGSSMDGNMTWWNNDVRNSSYDYTFTNINNNTVINATSISGVDLVSGSTWNCSIYAQYTGSSDNSSTSSTTKTVETIEMDDCSVNTEIVFNATLVNEETDVIFDTNVVNTSIELSVELYSWDNDYLVGNYSNIWTNNTNATICIENGVTNESNYRIDIEGEFTSSEYTNEFWFLDYGNLTNITDELNTYTNKHTFFRNLALADSTTFLFNYYNEIGVQEDNIIIHAFRKYIGEGIYKEVERAKEGKDGDAPLHLIEEDAIYYFLVTQNGIPLFTSNEFAAVCQATPCAIDLEESTDFIPFGKDWDIIPDGAYSISFDSATRDVKLTFLASNSSNWTMRLYKYSNNPANFTVVNTTSLVSTAGTLTTHVPLTAGNITFVARVYRDNGFISDNIINLKSDITGLFDAAGGTILTALIVLTLILMGATEGSAVIILAVIGFIFVGILGLINLNWLSAILLILIGALLLYKLSRRER